ncbi:MAG: VanZ family protein [Saprospiraceae bacterium]|nr:VanZ family protein [Saprospiraceae bacterium]
MFVKPGTYRKLGYLITGCICFGSLIPGNTLPRLSWDQLIGIDKVLHLLAYGSASYCFLSAQIQKTYFRIAAFLFMLGLLLEVLQKLLPGGRYFDLGDLLANLAGILLSVVYIHSQSKRIT